MEEVLVDALPYIDQEYDDPIFREAALQLIEEETKQYRPTKNYLEYLPTTKTQFESPLLKVEMERLVARQPMETLSMKRYELPQPGAAQKNDVGAWLECVNNSVAQLEHQSGRIINLELLSQYGSNEWKIHNEQLSRMLDRETALLRSIKNEIQEVNWLRKTEQTQIGTQLSDLGHHWTTLVHKNFDIEKACVQIKVELHQQQTEKRGIQLDS